MKALKILGRAAAGLAVLLFVLAGIGLAIGGYPYPLPADTVKNNAWMAAHGVVLPKRPAASGHYAPGTRVITETLKAPFGPLHLVRLESDPKKPLIVLCGGRSFREEAHGAELGEPLSRFGDVVMFDYPGFGNSGGSGTRAEFAEAEKVVGARVKAIAETRQGKVLFWGHSLGGGICTSLAAHTPVPSSLVLVTTFGSYNDFRDNLLGPFAPLVRMAVPDHVISFDVPALLKDYPGQIFVVTLMADETIPYAVEQRLAAHLSAEGKSPAVITMPGRGHATIHARGDFQAAMGAALRAKGLIAAQ